MDNLIVHITLPRGLALVNAQTLLDDCTVEVVGQVTPWYCSVDQVKLLGGSFLRNLSGITTAAMIYTFGREADMICFNRAHNPGPGASPEDQAFIRYQRFLYGRQRYVTAKATMQLILNLWDVNQARGGKTLGNFSVNRQSQTPGEEVQSRLTDLATQIKEFEIVVKSGGTIGQGGRPYASMAAKGLNDTDFPTGRTWITSGFGANRKSIPGSGAAGKPVKFGSPSLAQMRMGSYTGSGYMSTLPMFMGGYAT